MPLFRTSWLPALVARIFAEQPNEEIWEWADRDNVFLDATQAAEPGFYKSAKTSHTRRIQELCKRRWRMVDGRRVRVRKIVVKKASQTGYTEAVLNVIRWCIHYAPRNVIYAIDTAEEAANIRDRLVNTLRGEEIFTGDDDDLKRLKLTLRHMIVWFFGSFSPGKYANKQAPLGVVDEAEQHDNGKRSVADVESRTKTSEEGLVIVISKPEDEGGVIDAEHSLGNQEIRLVPCPFCGTYQELTLEKLAFDHCRTLLREWDMSRVLTETCIKCEATNCGELIPESYKPWMLGVDENNVERGRWFPTREGHPKCDPEVVSQELSDLYSLHSSVSWGQLAKRIIQTKHDRAALKELLTHSFARAWKKKPSRPEVEDILKCCRPYKRGEIPFTPLALLLGADVGKDYAKYVVSAVLQSVKRPDVFDLAVIDWGHEIHPDAIAHIVATAEYPVRTTPDLPRVAIMQGGIDAKHRAEDVYAACMRQPERLWPVSGGGGRLWRKSFALGPVGNAHLYPPWLRLISFNDRDFKTDLYLTRIKREVPPGIDEDKADEFRASMPQLWLPEDVAFECRRNKRENLIEELTHEPFVEDPETGEMKFERDGPNHFGDCTKVCLVLLRWLLRGGVPDFARLQAQAQKGG